MKLGQAGLFPFIAVLVCIGVVAVILFSGALSQPYDGPNRYTTRPTFYNLPAIVYSDSSYTEEIREHISYSTFNYELTSNASHIANAPVDVPIIIDGYSITVQNRQALVDACSRALLNGSVIITLWQNAYSLMHEVAEVSYGDAGFGMAEDDRENVLWVGLGAGVYVGSGTVGEHGPSMNTLTQAYEWCVRTVYDQPYHPTLYP